jgi:hypothetical protein
MSLWQLDFVHAKCASALWLQCIPSSIGCSQLWGSASSSHLRLLLSRSDGAEKSMASVHTSPHQTRHPLKRACMLHALAEASRKPCRRGTSHAHLHRWPSSNIIVRCGNFLHSPRPEFYVVSTGTMTGVRCTSPGLLVSQQMPRKRPFVQTLCWSSRSRRPVCPEPSFCARLALSAARRLPHFSTSRHSCL